MSAAFANGECKTTTAVLVASEVMFMNLYPEFTWKMVFYAAVCLANF